MIRNCARPVSRVIAAAMLALLSAPAHAETSCAELVRQGGKIVDTYVMDFGPSDKLYVYIVRMPGGAAEKCTSERPLRKQKR